MILDKINIVDEIYIYRTTLDYKKNELIKDLLYNNKISKWNIEDQAQEPGIQRNILITTPEINNLQNQVFSIFKNNFSLQEKFYHLMWVFISKNDNINTFYHTHTKNSDTFYKDIEWTYTFYVQMPDNLKDDDGCLYFKTENDYEYKILPKEGDLIIFPASLAHRPMTNNSSSQDRIVLAGVLRNIDINEIIIKENVSLI